MRLFPAIALMIFLSTIKNGFVLNTPVEYPWFIEHIAFESVDLPSGVSVSFVTDSSARPFEFIVFKNISSIPLLVVGKRQDNYAEFEAMPFEYPPDMGPLYKVIDDQAYIWRAKHDHPGPGFYYAWFKETERDDSVWLYVSNNKIWCQNAIISELESRNQFGGDRPKDVAIPDPQQVIVPIIYGSEQIAIPISVSYTLNEEYRSFKSIQREQTLCISLICLISVSAILLLIRGLAASKSRSSAL